MVDAGLFFSVEHAERAYASRSGDDSEITAKQIVPLYATVFLSRKLSAPAVVSRE